MNLPLSSAPLSSPSPDDETGVRAELTATAGKLVPILAGQAQESERLRRVSDDAARALREGGMFRLGTPRVFGGFGAGVRTSMEVTAELARGDASAAWIANIYTGGGLVASLMDERARQEVWGQDPDVAVAASLTPSGSAATAENGDLLVSGRWGWASGIDHAGWVALAIAPGAPDLPPVIALVPVAEVTVEDTWHVAGMAATGSNTVVADRVRVPAHRTLDMGAVLAGVYATRYEGEPRNAVAIASMLALTVVAPMLGMARAALDLTLDTAARKPMSLTVYERLADSPSVQLAVADAASLVDTAQLHAYRAADDLDHAAAGARQLTVEQRTRVRMDTAVAAIRTREAVDRLVSVCGASTFALANPLQRIWRDLGTASRHGVVNPDLAREIYGRTLLGITEQPTFII
ncbi:acyl-CoA dehydrogenase family protein [Streptomyces hyaluromycini]|uniref:acyl-CoA dehydrogenase family protein n=1 Tax=Streptomyces hyaluromycini TaxID=1377993 RepID=UPI000B5CC725|nr:acyl-CoA dehydrogenase family protein [Streptomyces hyaluromycini]